MFVFKQLLNFYINSSIHVALAVVSLVCVTLLEFDVPLDKSIIFFSFFSSITGYNFVKYFGIAKFHHRSLARWLKAIQIFSFFCFILLCYYAFQLNKIALLYIAGFGVVTFFYAIPFLPKRFFVDKNHNLRAISGLKIYLIALVWSGVTVFLPIVNNDIPVSADVVLTLIQRFIFVIVLMLPFEIRDLQFDSLKLSTIPQKIGVKRTKATGVLLLLIFYLLEFFKDDLTTKRIVVLALVALITLLFLVFSIKGQGKYYSSFWVEAIPIFWFLLLFI